jgi:hypothetical protein
LCPLSEETQPLRPLPAVATGNTQPVKTQPVRAVPAYDSDPSGSQLGRLIFAYRPRPTHPAFLWAWGLGGAMISLAPLGYGGYQAFAIFQKFGPVPALSRSAPWLILGGTLLLVWLSISLYRWARAMPGVRLHANGLYIEGRRERSLPWDQIDGIAHGVMAPEPGSWGSRSCHLRYQAILIPNKGSPVHLRGSGDGKSGLPELPELVSRVKASLYPVLQPELARMFRSGVPLFFGPVRIDRDGIRLRRRRLVPGMLSVPWRHVKRITIHSGYFLVELGDRRGHHRLPVSQIPNLEILLKIIDQGVHH